MILPTFCGKDCGGNACPLAVEVESGCPIRILKNSAAPAGLAGCRRGRDLPAFHLSPDRILKPLIRVGDRGSRDFRAASWDEALDLTARRLGDVRSRHGPGSVLNLSSSGSTGALHDTQTLTTRFLNAAGGATVLTGNYSNGAARFALPYLFGSDAKRSGFDPANLRHAGLVILWGANILEARLGTELPSRLLEARRNGARVIYIDPRYTETARRTDAWWIPVRPGTDAALMLAVLYVLLSEGLADPEFARRHSRGFDEIAAYVLGRDGGGPRDPAWAEGVCGVHAEDIRRLAREYGRTKPALLLPGYSIQRVYAGEDPFRLSVALQLATGNFGRLGGSTGSINNRLPGPKVGTLDELSRPDNPGVPVLRWPDAILEGRSGGYPSDIRAAYVCGSNFLNQGGGLDKSVRAFKALEFAVCHEMFLTPTARHCDVVLPAASPLEKEDIGIPWAGNWLAYKKAACPLKGSARTDYDIFSDLADRMGIGSVFTEGRSPREWLDSFLKDSEVPDHDAFRETGIYLAPEQERTGLADFARDPAAHSLGTPSGLVELSSEAWSRDTGLPPVPVWRPAAEEPGLPLLLISPKSPLRTHSQGGDPKGSVSRGEAVLTIHPRDAVSRGILPGSAVRIRNARGATRASAELSDSILPGTVSLFEGAWYDPATDPAGFGDAVSEDLGGSANLLTGTEGSPPSTACVMHGIPVEVERIR